MRKLLYSCVSDVGRQRFENQDNFICGKTFMEAGKDLPFPVSGSVVLKNAFPLAVLDGMGGEERGEMASLIASTIAAGTDFSGDPSAVLCRRQTGRSAVLQTRTRSVLWGQQWPCFSLPRTLSAC